MEKRFELIASSEVLSPLRKELRHLLGQEGWEKKTVEEVLLAVDEALTNIIRHAYQGKSGKMTVAVDISSDKIEIVLEDQGKKFDPTQVPTPETVTVLLRLALDAALAGAATSPSRGERRAYMREVIRCRAALGNGGLN